MQFLIENNKTYVNHRTLIFLWVKIVQASCDIHIQCWVASIRYLLYYCLWDYTHECKPANLLSICLRFIHTNKLKKYGYVL